MRGNTQRGVAGENTPGERDMRLIPPVYPADVIRGSKMQDPWVAVARGIHQKVIGNKQRMRGNAQKRSLGINKKAL